MRFRGFWYDGLTILIVAVFAAVFTVALVFVEPRLAAAQGAAFIVACAIAFSRTFSAKNRYKRFLIKTSKKLDFSDPATLSNFPFPVAVCDEDGFVVWRGERFINEISQGEASPTDRVESFTNGADVETLKNSEKINVRLRDKYYSIRSLPYSSAGAGYVVFYYLDETPLKNMETVYYESRPCALVIEIDNLDDSRTDFKDSERAAIKSRVEAALDEWSERYDSFVKKIGDERYLTVTERKNVLRMKKDGFSVLKTVREYTYEGMKAGVTLSIGVSSGGDVRACETDARKALEMALGRGGDQVAIKGKDGYEYVGGVSQSAEKKNKVRSRIVGLALSELIKSSGNVIITGHAYADLDVLGAAAAIAFAVKSFGVPAYIATDRRKTLAASLVERMDREGMGSLIIGGDEALGLIDKKSLLIVVDSQLKSLVEFPEVFEKAETRVIIDHHRRSEENVENVVIFHHDPGASSACEMVTELLQYMRPEIKITKFIAEALLSGIVLDTRDFVIDAGVKTFEAAAYLKNKNADTVEVKKLFANSMEVNKLRTRVVSSADVFMDCALASADFDSPDIRIISAQAADELTKTKGIKASFVIFEDGGAVNISARSLGDINVHPIMEALGGGGRRTMAACRIKGVDVNEAESRLKKVIKEFFDKNENKEEKK